MGRPRDLDDWNLDKAGGRLGYARQSRGLGRAALAPLMPINPRALESIEKGRARTVPYELARLYAVACDVSIDWLVFGTSANVPDLPPQKPKQSPMALYESQGVWLRRKLKAAGPRSTWPRCKKVEPEAGASGSISDFQLGETPASQRHLGEPGGAGAETSVTGRP